MVFPLQHRSPVQRSVSEDSGTGTSLASEQASRSPLSSASDEDEARLRNPSGSQGSRRSLLPGKSNTDIAYCRTHNVCVCLYIAYIAYGSASLYIKALYFFSVLWRCQRQLPLLTQRCENSPIRYIWDTPHMCVLQYMGFTENR